MKFWKCRTSAACFVNLPPKKKKKVWGILSSHIVRPDLREVFSRLCAAFSYEKGLVSSVTLNVLWYPDACSGREITSVSNTFPNELCSCATCQSTQQLNYSSAKLTGVAEDELAWQDGARRGSSSGSSYHDGCALLGIGDQRAGSFRSQKGSVLGLLALLQLCFRKSRFIFSCCITSVERLQRPWRSRVCCSIPTAGCTQNSFPSFGVLCLSSACCSHWYRAGVWALLSAMQQTQGDGAIWQLKEQSTPWFTAWLVRAYQRQSQASLYFLSSVLSAVVPSPAKGSDQQLERWCDPWHIPWSWLFGCGSRVAGPKKGGESEQVLLVTWLEMAQPAGSPQNVWQERWDCFGEPGKAWLWRARKSKGTNGKTSYINNVCDRHIIVSSTYIPVKKHLDKAKEELGGWDTLEAPYFCFLQNISALSPAEAARWKQSIKIC